MEPTREEQIAYNLYEGSLIQADLEKIGIYVNHYGQDLLKSREDWLRSVPIIKEWVFKAKSTDVFETLIRLLGIPPLRKTSTAKEIINLYYRPDLNDSNRWAMGNTMAVIANDEVLEDIIKIIDDEKNGKSREMFVAALGNMKDPKVVPYLVNLLDHPKLDGYAIMALNKLKAVETLEEVRKQVDNPRTWVRNEAKKTVRKFEKILEKQATKKNK